MKKVLVVSPHFPPINAADCHRARMYLPYFRDNGWEPVVLAVDPDYVEGSRDELLLAGLPEYLEIHRTRAWPVSLTRLWGSRTIGRRCYRFVKRTGDELLDRRRFDLVFFSTTAFSVFRLGPRWLRKFGVPFVIDLQDPWLSTYYDRHPDQIPPGGRLRYWLANRSARRWEPIVARLAAGIVVVSPDYAEQMRRRYPAIDAIATRALPFGASVADFDILDRSRVKQQFFDPDDGRCHVVYAGAAGAAFRDSLELLFGGLARLQAENGAVARRLRIHFIGTSYAPCDRARPSVRPIADKLGVGALIEEYPARVPYFAALKSLVDACAIVLPSSNERSYNASKLHTCLLTGKPILGIAFPRSVAARAERSIGEPVRLVLIGDRPDLAEQQIQNWLVTVASDKAEITPVNPDRIETAEKLTADLCRFFDERLGAAHKPVGIETGSSRGG